jgi:hypothetical protein
MTNPESKLREAFENHEHLAPDPAEVYARVQDLARTYKRRRRGAQAASGAVLGAGLIAGAINLPVLFDRPGVSTAAASQVGAPAPAVSPSVSPSKDALQEQWDAYFSAGYGYSDALKLAKLWKMNGDVGQVKAEAGRRLLAGQTLPIKPGPENPADSTPDPESLRVDAFFEAGYDYDDAVTLAKLWKTVDPYHAKIEGGKKLLAGETLPIRP